ncbi:hypothetical protein HPB51_002607 [Rhipicephalus microplus]|uniref:Puromycin-sensitive aminopeptidase n=1 Tax=Rhipicephalus microplus TaxID=6941 RepID=A0A9J6DF65_RHIMP|nr:hypothetical protein HPB51_002607 [Rhipicephalus microplus]
MAGFSAVSASSVIRMMAHFLTPEVFMRGVKTYLHKYRFKNVKQEDLLHELTSAQGDEQKVSVKRVMKSWLKTPGYPLLTVTRNYSTGTVVVHQEAYATRHDTKAIWNIPVTYTTMSEKNFDNNAKIEWLNKREGVTCTQTRHCFPQPDSLEPAKISQPNSRFDLSDSTRGNGHLPYEIALEFLDLVRPEDDYMPWKSALDGIHDLDFLIRKTKYYRKYQVFVRFILNKKFEAFTQERSSNLSATDDLLRKSIIMNSCYFENEACLAFSTNKFRIFLDEPSKIQKALRKNPWRTMVVLCQGVRLDNGSHWQFVLDHLDEAATDESKRAAVRALGCAENRSRLKELLNHAFDKPEFPGKMQYIFESLMETPMGEELASDFLLKNLKKLIRKYGTGPSMKHAIRAVVTGVRSVDRFNKIKHFHEDLSRRRRFPRRVDLAFVGALTEAERALLWTRNHGRQVEEWLDKKMSKKKDVLLQQPQCAATTALSLRCSPFPPVTAVSHPCAYVQACTLRRFTNEYVIMMLRGMVHETTMADGGTKKAANSQKNSASSSGGTLPHPDDEMKRYGVRALRRGVVEQPVNHGSSGDHKLRQTHRLVNVPQYGKHQPRMDGWMD